MSLEDSNVEERVEEADLHDTTDGSAIYFGTVASSYAYSRASEEGLRVDVPANNELFIDVDTKEQDYTFNENFDILQRYFQGFELVRRTTSRNGSGYHIVVKSARAFTHMERILLQAILGSDPMRELLSYVRLKNNDPVPTLFFEKRES